MRARVTLTRRAREAFEAAPEDLQRRLLRAFEALENDATPTASVYMPRAVFESKTLEGIDLVWYVADLSRDPRPVHVHWFSEA